MRVSSLAAFLRFCADYSVVAFVREVKTVSDETAKTGNSLIKLHERRIAVRSP